MNFLGLTFLNLPLLAGVSAAAIPLVIHLSRSRRTKTLKFSTTRFFTEQFLRSYRMNRLKELLLLVCRMALFALLAFALAQPFYQPKAGASAAPLFAGGSRAVVFVMDNSASMGAMQDGRTLLERAKAAAGEVLDTLGREDAAAVVLAGRREPGPEVLFPQVTPELNDVRQAVTGLAPVTLGTDLRTAVQRAGEIARASAASVKEVYVLSDLQDSGWEVDDVPAKASEVVYHFVQVRPASPANVAVTALQLGASRPMAGVPFAIRPQVAVQGPNADPINVRLFVDDKLVAERKLERQPNGAWAATRFYHTFAQGGWHSGYVEVDDPALPEDNRRYFAVEVLDRIPVLAVNGAPSRVPAQDELFFLRAALTAAGSGGTSAVQVDVIGPAELAGKLDARTDAADYPLVILANVDALPPAAVEKLEAYIDRGHSLLVFTGDRVNTSAYNAAFTGSARLHGGLLPARIAGAKPLGDPKGPEAFAFVGSADTEHPALTVFQDARAGVLTGERGVGFRALWELEPTGDAAVVMRASVPADGEKAGRRAVPLLVEKAYGQGGGRVMLFAGPCDRDWSNFPARPAFLPWLYRVVSYLSQEPLGRRAFFTTGATVPLPVSTVEGTGTVSVQKPDGATGFASPGPDAERPWVFEDTTRAGVYKVVPRGRGEKPALLAVNLESVESQLLYLDDVFAEHSGGTDRDAAVTRGLQGLLPGGGSSLVTYTADPARVREAAAAGRGTRLWDVLLWVVLAIALFEPWLANQISLRHYGRPKELAADALGRGTRGHLGTAALAEATR
jgi:hypothetical protein